MIDFIKMQGCGNDFIVIDARNQDVSAFLADSGAVSRLCDRHFGIGCDQLIVIQSHPDADAEMLIRNADGSVAGMCGNAARCVADILIKETEKPVISLVVGKKFLKCWRDEFVTVDMGPPLATGTADVGMNLPQGITIDMGNPHAVFFVEDADAVDLARIGPAVETHTLFPHKTNVEFASLDGPGKLRMRVWERGAGITLACGSGACATAYAAFTQQRVSRACEIRMDGGTLFMEIRESDGHILMAGPVATVFNGKF